MEIGFVFVLVSVFSKFADVRSIGSDRCGCTTEIVEVCGSDGATYSSPCQARCSGVKVERHGRCDIKAVPLLTQVQRRVRRCTCFANYDPVCGADGRTYSNSCRARCSGVRVIHNGACTLTVTTERYRGSAGCPGIFREVCGADGKTYDNSCWATVSGVRVVHEGKCEEYRVTLPLTTKFVCRGAFGPACGADGKTYFSNCEAGERGVRVVHIGTCEYKLSLRTTTERDRSFACPRNIDPVCGADGITYNNSCEAERSGVDTYAIGDCESKCRCKKVARPLNVCHRRTGVRYRSRCFARCLGVPENQLRSCRSKTAQ